MVVHALLTLVHVYFPNWDLLYPGLFTRTRYLLNMASYVLIIESDEELLCAIAELFDGEGYSVVSESESSDGITRLIQEDPGLVLIGDDVPPLDGVELLPILRRMTNSPIIVVGPGGEASVVKALLQGADMYLSTPINYRELLSRARALLRRSEPEAGAGSQGHDITAVRDIPGQISVYNEHEFGLMAAPMEVPLAHLGGAVNVKGGLFELWNAVRGGIAGVLAALELQMSARLHRQHPG